MRKTTETTRLPAGTYYVGDLCYVVPGDEWMDFVARSFPDSYSEVVGVFENREGINYANFGTKYGDGEYFDNRGARYGVDSGSIGCIPVCAVPEVQEAVRGFSSVVSFDEPFEVGYDDETGTIRFGHIEIVTGDYGEDEYEGDDEDDQ